MSPGRILPIVYVLLGVAGAPAAYGQYGGADDPPTVPLYLPPAPVAPSALPARIGVQMRNVYYFEPYVGWIYAVQVVGVEPGSPAGQAGIEPGDVISRINGVRTFTC